MNDDSLKKKIDAGNNGADASAKNKKGSLLLNMFLVNHCNKLAVELKQNPKLRNDLKIGAMGLVLGLVLGGLVAKLGDSKVSWQSLKAPGWNPVHVFYGKMNHILDPIPENWYVKQSIKHTTPNSREWFGQHGQDLAVAKFFNLKSNGYFVDLASNDAVWASNTFALEQNLNWRGICIEANPVYWYRLSFRTNCHVVGSIVGGRDFEEIKVRLPKDPKATGPYGGIVGKEFDNQRQDSDNEPRYTASLMGILKKFNAPKVIDYLSLDVEGAEEFIMKDFPFHKPYTFRVISIERPKQLLKDKLQEAGYQHVMDFKRGDTLWAHKSVAAQGKKRLENIDEAMKTHKLDDWPVKAIQ